MVMLPVTVVAEAYVLNGCLRWRSTDWNHQVLRALWHSYATAVAPRLLDVVLMLINLGTICMGKCHIIGHRSKVGGREREQVES